MNSRSRQGLLALPVAGVSILPVGLLVIASLRNRWPRYRSASLVESQSSSSGG